MHRVAGNPERPHAQLDYSYTVQGQVYFCRSRRRFLLKGRADKWINSFTKSGIVTVRDNPPKVEYSVLFESDQVEMVTASGGSDAGRSQDKTVANGTG
jgi:hypothetical protein